uniref:ShKT domain-containing protein n=1 Tax=Parastrongyloides trichosuri TaxID=131310 RepID=A0A0N4ZD78_PARTI
MIFKGLLFIIFYHVNKVYAVGLFEACVYSTDCKVGFKPACVNIGNKNLCVEQCDDGEDLFQCGIGKKCNLNSMDVDGNTIRCCATEIKCLSMKECTKKGEVCSPYSLTCVPSSIPTTTISSTFRPYPLIGKCIDKGFIGTNDCSVIKDLCLKPIYKDFMQEYCAKTCGFCREKEITSECDGASCGNNTFEVKLKKELVAYIKVPPNF